MRVDDTGVIGDSVVYSNIPSPRVKESFLYPTYLGHYYCNSSYYVDRNSFSCFLFLYVKKGEGYVLTHGKLSHMAAGSMLILDCYAPHIYYTSTSWEILWVHFDGPTARKYYDYAAAKGLILSPSNPARILQPLYEMLELFSCSGTTGTINELILTRCLTDLLTEYLCCTSTSQEQQTESTRIESAVKYVSEHLHENITLDQLADYVNLSPFYFSRLFKERTGFTPYKYLLTARLDYSCYLLRSGSLTIKEISFNCGFHSESSFCTAFRKQFGITPKQYREKI